MTVDEFLEIGEKKFGRQFEEIVRYAAGMLCRGITDLENCIEILENLDDYSYEVN